MKNEKTMYIRNGDKGGTDEIIIHMDDNLVTIASKFTWYTDRYAHLNLILDLDASIALKTVHHLIKVLRMVIEYNNATLDITLRCHKLLREYDFYDDIKKLKFMYI